MSTDVSQATIDEIAARARHEAAALLVEVHDHGWKRAELARNAANNLTVLRLVEGDTVEAHVYAKAAVLLTTLYSRALRVSVHRLVTKPPAGATDRLLADLYGPPASSSSVAGLASLRRGAAVTGSAYPQTGELPCGHRLEDACEACVPPVPSLVAMAARHYPEQCVSNASCTCACDTCMAEHNPEGA